ncbi:right-handed parallel beta-helix repeat-containing protein [archaeon]|nr:right-handed parallel beta-helix repeat-containing protein [archaeon]
MKHIKLLMAIVLLLSSFYLIGSVTRTISNFQDNKEMMIRNSNGNYWEPIGSNIQTAIDDFDSEGGTVWIPAGTFEIGSQRIELKSNIKLIGNGIGNTILKKTEIGTMILLAEDSKNFTISDLTLDGNRRGGGIGHAMRTGFSEDFILEKIQIVNPSGAGIYVSNCKNGIFSKISVTDTDHLNHQGIGVTGSDGLIFNDCVLKDCKQNMCLDITQTSNTQVNNMIIKDSQYGIKITGKADENDFTENSSFNNIIISGGEACLQIKAVRNSNFNNINLVDCDGGISVLEVCENININNVNMQSTGSGMAILGKNINVNNVHVFEPDAYSLRITNAENVSISNYQSKGSNGWNSISQSNGITITDSIFSEGTATDHVFIIRDSQNVIFSGSQIINNAGNGLYFDDTGGPNTNFIVSDNLIRNNARGIYLDNGAHNNFILTNNIVQENTNGNINDNTGSVNKLIGDNLT